MKIIANIMDGRVLPLYSADAPIPDKFVEVPMEMYRKWVSVGAKDGVALAKAALAGEADVKPAAPKSAKAKAEPAATELFEPRGGSARV